MNTVLDNEHPDLVILNGDLLSCEYVSPTSYNTLLDQVVSPMITRDLPFAATFGNHDYSETCNTHDMAAHMWYDVKGMSGKKLSFTTQSVDGANQDVGESNYYIPVYSSKDSERLEMLLWFFDSRGGHVFQPGANLDTPTGDSVHDRVPHFPSQTHPPHSLAYPPQVVTWFQQTRNQFTQQNARIIPSLVFVHIPVQATRAFQKTLRTEATEPGIDDDVIGHQGDCPGIDCYTRADYGFMKALVETEGLVAVFSGHDHGVE